MSGYDMDSIDKYIVMLFLSGSRGTLIDPLIRWIDFFREDLCESMSKFLGCFLDPWVYIIVY